MEMFTEFLHWFFSSPLVMNLVAIAGVCGVAVFGLLHLTK